MAGIISLIPGLAVYRALYGFMDAEFAAADTLPPVVMALATGIGLAAGTTIGGFGARRLFGFDRQARLATQRSRAPR
jgi:uncharacterized membrane protein YjjB (DUF3815 family)